MLVLPANAPPLPVTFLSHETAPAYWLIDIVWFVLADGEATGGAYSVMEQWMRRGSGPPVLHVHSIDGWFYVLDGEMEMTVGGTTANAKGGDSVYIPHGTPHRFRVTSEVCRALNGYAPAGFERVIVGSAKPADRRELPPPMYPPDAATVGKIFNNYRTSEAAEPRSIARRLGE